jgi:hypothetical protein
MQPIDLPGLLRMATAVTVPSKPPTVAVGEAPVPRYSQIRLLHQRLSCPVVKGRGDPSGAGMEHRNPANVSHHRVRGRLPKGVD